MRCSPSMRMLVTAKSPAAVSGASSGCASTNERAGAPAAAPGRATGPGTGPCVWAEHTAEPTHSARVVTNPNRFINRLPARVLLEIYGGRRFAKANSDRLRMNGPRHSAAITAELQGQLTRFGICLQDILEAADLPPGSPGPIGLRKYTLNDRGNVRKVQSALQESSDGD